MREHPAAVSISRPALKPRAVNIVKTGPRPAPAGAASATAIYSVATAGHLPLPRQDRPAHRWLHVTSQPCSSRSPNQSPRAIPLIPSACSSGMAGRTAARRARRPNPRQLTVAPAAQRKHARQFQRRGGQFLHDGHAGPTNVAAGDPVTVKVQISGRGALDSLALPEQTPGVISRPTRRPPKWILPMRSDCRAPRPSSRWSCRRARTSKRCRPSRSVSLTRTRRATAP